ncbi:ABC transporter ATP-binding protein [uncultured Cohaesibacter sp.]|uniref:ABC transporter ATP-binding protein n=1 Tax=uncultured Cohaesibacter sp. TaxID=1002546 RepID=UPI0029C98309|nr:ABC transporter ATP-binding protein [uncultured Cohaesibacter sp.]
MAFLTVSKLGKNFGGIKALNELTYDVKERSVLGVLGMNGSGKTTMLNCINGIYNPDAGDIYFDGQRINDLATHEIFELGIGRTFQVPKLFHKLTLLENLMVPLLNTELSDKEIAERSEVWLRRVNLWNLRYNFAEELSGGQQKLVEIARVMIAGPKLVLLDEPFAGVNPSLALLLIEVISEMPSKDGCSVILVSHDLTSVYRLSSSILVMHEGQKLAQGSAEEIKNNPEVIETYLGT